MINHEERNQIFHKLRACLLEDVPANFEELALISIVDAANVYRLISNVKGECHRMKEKYESLLTDNVAGNSATDLILKIKNALFHTYNSYDPETICAGK